MVNAPISQKEVEEMQAFYNDGHSLTDVQKKFGRSRMTLVRKLKTRSPEWITEEERRKRAVNKVVCWRQRTKQKLVDYKGGKCQVCGYNRWVGNLAFHHIDPSKKDFTITAKTIAFEKLRAEVDKCILLCHICHGEVHAGLISIPL
jgi:hypothetical protein